MSNTEKTIIKDDEQIDDLILGGLHLIQSREGYRFSLDAVLLSFFPELVEVRKVVDLGTGNGVIPLLLSVRSPHVKIYGVEIQDSMVDRAKRTISYNKLQNRIEIMQGDIREIEKTICPQRADLVISNPPFWKKGQGKINTNSERAIARHELRVEMPEIVKAAAYSLKPEGSFCLIHRANRLPEIIAAFSRNRLAVNRLRMVHSHINREAKMILIEGKKAGKKGLRILPPLIIYEKTGEYSSELRQIYRFGVNGDEY